MVPPMGIDNKIHNDWPLGHWDIVGSYDDARQCHAGKLRIEQGLESPEVKAGMHPVERSRLKRKSDLSECIASDDPRLKGN